MRVKILVLLAALFAFFCITAPVGSADAERRPALAVVSDNPLTVAGRGYRRFERVTVRTSVHGSTYTRRIRAGRLGRFTVRFARVSAECHPFAAAAVGAGGSRASARRIAIPPPCGMVIQP
jgi:hypothetical protein